MPSDRRKKGCPNPQCRLNRKHTLQKVDVEVCPECGTPLKYVCPKCFNEIEDLGPKHIICDLCDAKADEKKKENGEKAKKVIVNAGKVVLTTVVVPIAAGIYKEVTKEGTKAAIKKGVELVEKVGPEIIKTVVKK